MTTGQQYFFAIQLPSPLQKSLVRWRADHFPADNGRPLPASDMLMTLAWLGPLREITLQRLQQQAARIQQRGFMLTLNDAGYWPGSGLVWLGCRPAPAGLLALGALLRSQAARQGCPQPSQPFRPHVRLLHHVFSPVSLPPTGFHWQFPVTGFSLMACAPGRGRAKNRCLATFPLQPSSPL